jgi:hypothetical protein
MSWNLISVSKILKPYTTEMYLSYDTDAIHDDKGRLILTSRQFILDGPKVLIPYTQSIDIWEGKLKVCL